MPSPTSPPKPQFERPALPDRLLLRSALLGRLQAGASLGVRLTTVVAGPGFGKTTLLAQYAVPWKLEGKVLWIRLSRLHNDPVMLFDRLVTGFRYHFPQLSKEAFGLLRTSTTSGPALAMGAVCDELSGLVDDPVLVVLDGLEQLDTGSAVEEGLYALIDDFPDESQLVLSGRTLGPLKLSRYALGGQIVSLTEGDLRLEPGEISHLAVALGQPEPSADLVALLWDRTQGWVSGLMYGLAEGSDAALGRLESPELLYDFMAEEVYGRLPEELREPLLAASFLPQLERPSLCGLLGPVLGRTFLDSLNGQGALVRPREGRLHPLFKEFLQRVFWQSSSPDAQTKLFSHLAETALAPEEAIEYLQQASLWDEAAKRMVDLAPVLFRQGRTSTVRRLVLGFPEPRRAADAGLLYALGEALRLEGDLAKALETLSSAERTSHVGNPVAGRIWASLAATYGERGDRERQLEFAQRATSSGPPDDALAASLNVLGMHHLSTGAIDEAATTFARALATYRGSGDVAGEIRVLHNLGFARATGGDLRSAIASYEESIRIALAHHQIALPQTYNNIALCRMHLGQIKEAWQAVADGLSLAERLDAERSRVLLMRTVGHLRLASQDPIQARESFVASLDAATQAGLPEAAIAAHLGLAKAWLASSEPDEAERAVDRARSLGTAALTASANVEGTILRAEVALHRGDLERTREYMEVAASTLEASPFPLSSYFLEQLWVRWCVQTGDEVASRLHQRRLAELHQRYGYPLVTEKPGAAEAAPAPLAEEMRVRCLGPFEVELGGFAISPKAWRSAKSKVVLVCLLMHDRGVSKESLMELLYSQGDPAPSGLHIVITRLRNTLEPDATKGVPSRFVLFQGGRYVFNRGIRFSLDVTEFREHVNAARRSNDPVAQREHLENAISLYAGPFMEEFPDVEWCLVEREGLRRLVESAFEQLICLAAEGDDWAAAEDLAQRWRRLDADNPDALRTAIVALAMGDREGDALSLADVAERGGTSSEETLALIAKLRSGGLTVREALGFLPTPW